VDYNKLMEELDKEVSSSFESIDSKGISKSATEMYDEVEKDVKAVVDAAKGKALTKVIIECCYLTDEEKVEVCKRCVAAGAEYVKTSTGFGTHGATAHDVKLMKDTVGDAAEVKAAGGVRTFEDLVKMVESGATRIGTSGGPKLFSGSEVTGY
jgi:deoxyribose-phosphate aldolase